MNLNKCKDQFNGIMFENKVNFPDSDFSMSMKAIELNFE